jgi:hypothetical protein
MGLSALTLALLASAAVAGGASVREGPLIVTSLSDPEQHLVAQSASGTARNNGLDPAMQDFASALSRAAAAEQQSIAARCRSIGAIPATGAIRTAWEANCRYQRR